MFTSGIRLVRCIGLSPINEMLRGHEWRKEGARGLVGKITSEDSTSTSCARESDLGHKHLTSIIKPATINTQTTDMMSAWFSWTNSWLKIGTFFFFFPGLLLEAVRVASPFAICKP